MGLWGKVKAYVKRAGDNVGDYAKRAGRATAPVKAKVQPYAVAGGTFALNFVPVVGPALALGAGAIATAAAPYRGATAARAKGKSGSEAKEAGRDQRTKVGYAAAIGTASGFLTSLLTGTGIFATSQADITAAALASENAYAASLGSGATLPAAEAAAGAAAAGGGGILGTGLTWTQVGGALLGLAGQWPTGTPKIPSDPGAGLPPLPGAESGGSAPINIGIGGETGAPGDPGFGAPEGFLDTPGGKLLLAGGALAALVGGYAVLKKKAG